MSNGLEKPNNLPIKPTGHEEARDALNDLKKSCSNQSGDPIDRALSGNAKNNDCSVGQNFIKMGAQRFQNPNNNLQTISDRPPIGGKANSADTNITPMGNSNIKSTTNVQAGGTALAGESINIPGKK